MRRAADCGHCRPQALGLGKSGIRDDVQIEPFAPRGSVWALSQALRFLWQPQPWLQRAVERARASMPPSTGPILGVHVRHGDACAAGRECYTWGQYRQAALRMKAKYGVARIMLATDSQEASLWMPLHAIASLRG